MTVFCDWLDVTCSPELSFVQDLNAWAVALYPIAYSDETRVMYDLGIGKLVTDAKNRFHRASVSGGAIRQLVADEKYLGYLGMLATVPHSVTRLDAALDLDVDAPIVLRKLEQLYPDDRLKLTRKALTVTRMYTTRDDGLLSGTWYAGRRTKARVSARVYDKQLEALNKRGELLPPTTRYELTFLRDIGCTLRDAYMPASLFYEYASPSLLDRPPDVPPWDSHAEPWHNDIVATTLTYTRFRRRVDESPELKALCDMAAELGPDAQKHLLRVFTERVQSAQIASKAGGV